MRFRRFAAGFMAAIIVITSSVPVAYADWEDVIYETVMVPFSELTVHAIETFADIINGAGNALIRDPILKAHDFWSQWIRDESLEYRDFISSLNTLDSNYGGSVITSSGGFVFYPTFNASATVDPSSLAEFSTFDISQDIRLRFRVTSLGQTLNLIFYSESFVAPYTCTGSFSELLYDLDLVTDESPYCGMSQYLRIFEDGSCIASDDRFDKWDNNGGLPALTFTLQKGRSYQVVYKIRGYFSSNESDLDGYHGLYIAPNPMTLSDLPETAVVPESSTRTSSLMQALDVYNAEHMYDRYNTAINYMIGTQADDGSVSNVYSPSLYDEETLIFTEPVTGTQYQTNGWTYDYTTRTYYMTLDSGTMYIDGTEVTAVYLVYGDDNVEISYLSGSGATELIKTDTYAYVMVSQSACNINGHTYTYEDVSDPTCTTPGERKYTCSICGNEYAEEIPATGGHAYEYSIYQAATCTADGTGLYTCSTCGDQYTEPITATGHIDQILESVPTVYDEEGIVVSLGYTVYECTVCGDQRRVNDEIAEESQGLISGITSAIVSFAKAAWSAIASGIGKLFSGFADLLGGIFGFFTDTVVGGVKSFFSTLSDDSILGYYQDETGTAALPEGVGSAMAMIPAFFGGLPAELQAPVIFGIAALFLIAALKLFL